MRTLLFKWIYFICLLALTTPGAYATGKQPNLILVMPDDVGYGDYACLGNPVVHTPAVDAFKKQSLMFNQFHVSPTCAPCRSALMSGRHEFKNGVTHTIYERERMNLKTFTLAQMLQSAGYTTGIFGKWHLGDEEPYRPENRGFDEVYIHGGGGIGQTFPGSCGDAPGNSNIDPALWHNGKFEKTKGYCTDLFFAQALRWMNTRRTGAKPFFAYIPLNAAHSPLVVPEEYCRRYQDAPGVNKASAKFFGMIENIDTNFGVLLKKLDDWGITEQTLVIYLGSDNGGTEGVQIFNAGMRGRKGTPYQGGTRIPAFFRWPGVIPQGIESPALAAHLDIFPTLAEIVGASLPPEAAAQVEGRSMLSLLKNPGSPWADRTLVHHVGRWEKGKVSESKYLQCAIQNSRFSLVNNQELYDLQNDPGETHNVLAEHTEVAGTLRRAYDQWWNDVQPLLVNENAVGPEVNPMKALYWKQFGGGPSESQRKKMDPHPKLKSSPKSPNPKKESAER